MAEKLRRKFIIISVSAVFIVLSLITVFINVSNYRQIGKHSEDIFTVVSKNDGAFPKPDKHRNDKFLPGNISPETPFSTRYFTVKTDTANNLINTDTGSIFMITSEGAVKYGSKALQSGKTEGFIGNYKYKIITKDYGKLIIFIDCSRDLQTFRSALVNSIFIVLLAIVAVFIIVLMLSRKAISPVVESYEKQKQFITDASHELKTPLAIINANTEVVEMDCGENEWTQSTHNQIERLSELINGLVSLTRMDEESNQLIKTDFSISDAVAETAEPFVTVAQSKNYKFSMCIDKNVTCYGNEQSIRQLVSIFLDNAMKYSAKDGEISLSLEKQGKKSIIKTVNNAEGLKKGNYNILFERFYRADSSRCSKTGGYGIGLSVAKAIVAKHKGKITAESPDGERLIITAII